MPGSLRGVEIDTRHFTGNYPPAASLDACDCAWGDPDQGSIKWLQVSPLVSLKGDNLG